MDLFEETKGRPNLQIFNRLLLYALFHKSLGYILLLNSGVFENFSQCFILLISCLKLISINSVKAV